MRVAHAGADATLVQRLERACKRRGLDPAPLKPGEPAEAVLLGPGLDEPLTIGQAVGRQTPSAVFLFVVEPERLGAMRQAAAVAPFLGAGAHCVALDDEEMPTHVARLLERAVRQARGKSMRSFVEASLGGGRGVPAGHVLDTLLQKAPVGVALLTSEARIVGWNQAAADITSTTEREAIGAPLATALRAADPTQVARALSGQSAEAVGIITPAAPRSLRLTAGEVRLGERAGQMVMFQDISEQVRVQHHLQETLRTLERRVEERTQELTVLNNYLRREVEQRRQAEARLEQAQRLAQMGPWHLEGEDLVLGGGLRETLGLPASLPRARFLECVEATDREAVDRCLAVAAAGRPGRVEFGLVRPDGALRFVELRAGAGTPGTHATAGEQGTPQAPGPPAGPAGSTPAVAGLVGGTMLDVTERRALELERAKAAQRLQEIHRLREEGEFRTRFLNAVAHELNTPLTPMRIQIDMLGEASPEQAVALWHRSIEVLRRNFDRLERLVADVLDVTRAQADRLPLHVRPLELSAVVAAVAASSAPLAAQAEVELEVEQEPARAHGDPDRLAQALGNLVDNAIRLTPAGGSVRILAGEEDGEAFLRVADTGAGLQPQQIEHLFQPFQVHDDPGAAAGSRLGLHIAREIARLHGGRLTAASPGPGKGSIFTLYLPLEGPSGRDASP